MSSYTESSSNSYGCSSKLTNFVHGTSNGYANSNPQQKQNFGPLKSCNVTRTCCSGSGSGRGQVPVMVHRCPCPKEFGENNDAPSRRLLNIDAMEELCYFRKNDEPSQYDCYNVCECCGVMTKYMKPHNCDKEDQCNCTPVKYARRQRFTFKDSKGKASPSPPWPFELSSRDNSGSGSGEKVCCNNNVSCDDSLPGKSGIYYFSKTENRMIYQQKDNCGQPSSPPPQSPPKGSCQFESSSSQQKSPVIIQPMCNGLFGFNPFMNSCMMSPWWCNSMPCCNPCRCRCGCGTSCNNSHCHNSCCCQARGPPCNCCCCYPSLPPPQPQGQTTVIPMCIPINPPPPMYTSCCKRKKNKKKKKKKKYAEAIIKLSNSCSNSPCCDSYSYQESGSVPPSSSYQADGCSNDMENVSFDNCNCYIRPQSCYYPQQPLPCCSQPRPQTTYFQQPCEEPCYLSSSVT